MFNNLKNILIGILSAVIVIAIGASAYTAFASNEVTNTQITDSSVVVGNGNGNGNGGGTGAGTGTGTDLASIPASDLSAEETAALLYMREEEKLARDVYNALFTIWGQPTFQNIAASEQMHTDEIKMLLDRYALTDPALDAGKFTDPALQALYDQLVAQGSVSLADALKVGAAIEEIDILDLQTRLAQTDNADIQQVYNNLMKASYSHLNAFSGALTQQTGEVYQPQYLSAEAYQAIAAGSTGNGGSHGANGQGNSGGNGQSGQSTQGAAGSAVPQANITGVSTIHGVVNSFDGMGVSITTDDGQAVYVQLGNSRYNQSLGFSPQVGEGMTLVIFPDDQGSNSAISVTMDATGMVYNFRTETGQPLWSGGNGNGNGGNGNHP